MISPFLHRNHGLEGTPCMRRYEIISVYLAFDRRLSYYMISLSAHALFFLRPRLTCA